MGNLVQPCMNGKKMQDSGVRLSVSRLKIHVRVEDSLSIQAREESNASRNFRQSQRKISDKSVAKDWHDVYFCFERKTYSRQKHFKTPHLNRKEGHRPKIAKIHSSLSAQEKTKCSNMFKSLPLLFSLWSPGAPSYPAPQVWPPSVTSGADPKCKGLV